MCDFLPLSLRKGGWLGKDFGWIWMQENNVFGNLGPGPKSLVGMGTVCPAGVNGLNGEAVAGPLSFVGVLYCDEAGTGADYIVVEVDDGSRWQGLDFDSVVACVGLAFADDFFKHAGLFCIGAAGAEREAKAEKENGGKDFHNVKSINSPSQPGGKSSLGLTRARMGAAWRSVILLAIGAILRFPDRLRQDQVHTARR